MTQRRDVAHNNVETLRATSLQPNSYRFIMKNEKHTYYLNTNVMPTIPVPHDCVIKEIMLEEDSLHAGVETLRAGVETLRATSLQFIFEDDITYHDSIKSICPNSDFKSLIIKFHLLDDIHDISMFVKKKTNRYHTTSLYKEIFLSEDKYALLNLPKNRLEYLGHNVGYCSIIVKLWSKKSIVLDMTVDYVEFEWIGG